MKKSTAYNITKLIQQFLETAQEIKTQYLDTCKYTLEDNGTEEMPNIRSLIRRLIVWCQEDDASRYMGTPYLDEDTMSAYAEHIIDSGDIIASGKVSKEQLETLNSVIESFDSIARTSEGKFSGVPSTITSVYNTLMYIKDWEQDYCHKIEDTLSEEKLNSQLISEDDIVNKMRSVPVSQVEIPSILDSLRRFRYEFSKLNEFRLHQHLVFENVEEAKVGIDFHSVNLYNKKQTTAFYDKVYEYSKTSKPRLALFGYESEYDDFPMKVERRNRKEGESDILHFYYEATICKWGTLYIDLLRLYDYSIANDDIDIIRDIKEDVDESGVANLVLGYSRLGQFDSKYDESINLALRDFLNNLYKPQRLIDKFILQHDEGLVGESEISNWKLKKAFLSFPAIPSLEGNKSKWTKKTVERFMNLSISDFVFVLRGHFDAVQRPGLKKFAQPSFDDVYGYLDAKTASFNNDRMKLILAQMMSANEDLTSELQQYAVKGHILFEEEDEETGQKRVEYEEDTPFGNNGEPDPEKCYERLFCNSNYPDTYLYDYAVGILYEKLGYVQDVSDEAFEVEGVKIHKYDNNIMAKRQSLSTAEAFDLMDRIHRQSDLIGAYFTTVYGSWPDGVPDKFTKVDRFGIDQYEAKMSAFRLKQADYDALYEYLRENEDMTSAYSLYNWNWLVCKRIPMLLKDLYEKNKIDLNEEAFPAIEMYEDFRSRLRYWLDDMEDKYYSWDKNKLDNFYAIGIEEFTIIIEGWQKKYNNNGNLFLYYNLEKSTVYTYLFKKTSEFQREACELILSEMAKAKEKQYDLMCMASKLYYTIPKITYNCEFSDAPDEYFDFAPLNDDGSLNEKQCLFNCFGECNDSELYKYAIRILESKVDATLGPLPSPGKNDEAMAENATPIDEVFREEVKPYKRKAIFDHIVESKDNPNAHNYIGAIAEALRNNKMVNNKYADFAKLAPFLGKSVGIDEAKMNIRATRIGQVHKTNAERFIQQVVKSRGPRK